MPARPSHNEKEIFLLIAEGDESAFTELFHLFTPRLLPFLLKFTRNEQQAKEIIQETFLKLWVNRAELVKVERPADWIFRIASNISIGWFRKESNRRRLLVNAPLPGSLAAGPGETVELKELDGIIRRAVDTLPGRRKEIYQLSRGRGLSHQQIADELGISANTVKNQIGIALKHIQEYINKETGLSIATLIILLTR